MATVDALGRIRIANTDGAVHVTGDVVGWFGEIHPEVRKLYPGASVPEFDFDTSSPDVLLIE